MAALLNLRCCKDAVWRFMGVIVDILRRYATVFDIPMGLAVGILIEAIGNVDGVSHEEQLTRVVDFRRVLRVARFMT